MKQNIRHRFFIGLMLVTALLSVVPTSVFAAGNSVSLTPASGTSQTGNTFTLSTDGYAIGGWWTSTSSVSGTITFPANLLKVASISADGTSFPSGFSASPDNTNGTISFTGSCSGWFCGYSNQNVHLFAITFQSLAPGTANVNFNNVQYNTGAAAMSGGTYTIASPPPPPPAPHPSPVPSPKPSSKPVVKPSVNSTPAPTPAPSITPTPEDTPAPIVESDGGLKIQDVKITTNRQENIVTWSLSNSSADTTLNYGTSKNNQKSDGLVTQQNDGSYKASLANLQPGTLYYFTIKASTSDNLQGATYSGVLTTRGYPVQLTVEQNNLLLPGAKVKIDERNFVADENAIVTTELSDGTHKALITPTDDSGSHGTTFTVEKKTIPKGGDPALQSFILNITSVGSSPASTSLLLPVFGGAAGVVVVAGGIVGFLLFRRSAKNREDTGVDSDLLATTYGTAIDQFRNNTPEPNLEASTGTQSPSQISAGQTPQVPQPSQASVDTTSLAPAPMQTIQQSQIPAPITPAAAVDLSQQPTVMQDFSTPTIESTQVSQGYSETEQLSPELTQELIQVESGNVPSSVVNENDEPSAVYNEATGELDILHHHQPTPSLTDASTMPLVPVQQTDPSYLQITRTPQPTYEQAATPQVPSQVIAAPIPPQPPLSQPPLTAA